MWVNSVWCNLYLLYVHYMFYSDIFILVQYVPLWQSKCLYELNSQWILKEFRQTDRRLVLSQFSLFNYWQMLEKSELPSGSLHLYTHTHMHTHTHTHRLETHLHTQTWNTQIETARSLLFKPPTQILQFSTLTYTHWRKGMQVQTHLNAHTHAHTHMRTHTYTEGIHEHGPQPQSGRTPWPPVHSLKEGGREQDWFNYAHNPPQSHTILLNHTHKHTHTHIHTHTVHTHSCSLMNEIKENGSMKKSGANENWNKNSSEREAAHN